MTYEQHSMDGLSLMSYFTQISSHSLAKAGHICVEIIEGLLHLFLSLLIRSLSNLWLTRIYLY